MTTPTPPQIDLEKVSEVYEAIVSWLEHGLGIDITNMSDEEYTALLLAEFEKDFIEITSVEELDAFLSGNGSPSPENPPKTSP